jgi:hypothetical protein
MAKPSKALIDFRNSLKMADELRRREKKFDEIPLPEDEDFVYGLRGGSIVLMVAAFENFLEELTSEKLEYLKQHPKFDPKKLPPELIFHNCSNTFKNTPEISGKFQNPVDRVKVYHQAATLVVNTEIDSQLFTLLADNNPNPKKVQKLFGSIGIPDIFKTVKPKFDKKWERGDPRTGIEISQELGTLIDRRHEVAHKAYVMGFSRDDLKRYIRFLRILASVLDEVFNSHIQKMVK